MGCTEIKSKKYQTRKSPPFHAKDCKGMTRKGKDGMYVSKADKNKVYKWVKVGATMKKTKGMKTYTIHDNGGKPFLVGDFGGKVVVYKQDYNEDMEEYTLGKKLLEIGYKKIFVGDNTLEQEGYEPKGEGKGNSILLQLSKNKYMFIGWKIETFATPDGDEILRYYSPIGNNDVPYPYAIGKKYTYLMIENVYLPNEVLEMYDVYGHYYGHLSSQGATSVKKDAKSMKMKVVVKRVF